MTRDEASLLITSFHKNFKGKLLSVFDNLVLVGRTSLIFHPDFYSFYTNNNTLYFMADGFEAFNKLRFILGRYSDLEYSASYGLNYQMGFTHEGNKFTVMVIAPTLSDSCLLTDYMRRAAHPTAPDVGVSFKCLKPELVLKHWFKH